MRLLNAAASYQADFKILAKNRNSVDGDHSPTSWECNLAEFLLASIRPFRKS
jgi:hypothetical protein